MASSNRRHTHHSGGLQKERRVSPIRAVSGGNNQGDAFVGMMDCIFALGVAMANAGLMQREELAEAFESVVEQHEAREDCQSAARQYPAQALAKLFRANVVTRVS